MKLRIFSLAVCAVLGVSTLVAQTTSEIAGKKWKLTEINGAAVTRGNAYLEFNADTNKYHGSSGCNVISGNYKIEGTQIRFSEGIITRRACLDTEEQKIETEFMRAFSEVTNFQVEGEELRLYKGDQLLLLFKV